MKSEARNNSAKWSCPSASDPQPLQALSRSPTASGPPKVVAPPRCAGTQTRQPRVARPTALVTNRLQQLLDANEELQHEVLRCNDRLNVILELSETSGLGEDPDAQEQLLLRRYASTLKADALLVDYCDERGMVATVPARVNAVPVDPETVAAVIADDIRAVRQKRRSVCINATNSNGGGAGMHAMLGALLAGEQQPHVVIALRNGEREPFDRHDAASSETILVYGGHLLRSLRMVRRLQQTSLEAVASLANAVDARDAYTGGHSERVGWLARLAGEALGLGRTDLQMLEWSGLLHDIGKIGVPERILHKPGKLTPSEFDEIKKHPHIGYEVLRPLSGLKPVLEAVLHHHENHDGSGYPDGLSGGGIPLFARILRVVDTFDALTSTRSYRRGLSANDALGVLKEMAGNTTDPDVTQAFVAALQRLIQSDRAEFERRFPHLA